MAATINLEVLEILEACKCIHLAKYFAGLTRNDLYHQSLEDLGQILAPHPNDHLSDEKFLILFTIFDHLHETQKIEFEQRSTATPPPPPNGSDPPKKLVYQKVGKKLKKTDQTIVLDIVTDVSEEDSDGPPVANEIDQNVSDEIPDEENNMRRLTRRSSKRRRDENDDDVTIIDDDNGMNGDKKMDGLTQTEVKNDDQTAAGGGKFCLVCQAHASGIHYGIPSCEACKCFFRRSSHGNKKYECRSGTGNCRMDMTGGRNYCLACRLEKCVKAGMTRPFWPKLKTSLAKKSPQRSSPRIKMTDESTVTNNEGSIEKMEAGEVVDQ